MIDIIVLAGAGSTFFDLLPIQGAQGHKDLSATELLSTLLWPPLHTSDHQVLNIHTCAPYFIVLVQVAGFSNSTLILLLQL